MKKALDIFGVFSFTPRALCLLVIVTIQATALAGIGWQMQRLREQAGTFRLLVKLDEQLRLSPISQEARQLGMDVQISLGPLPAAVVLRKMGGTGVVYGSQGVVNQLMPFMIRQVYLKRCILAPVSLAIVATGLFLVPFFAKIVALLAPFAIVTAAFAIGMPCLTCGGSSEGVKAFLAPALVAMAAALACGLWRPSLLNGVGRRLFALLCGTALVIQALLQWSDPRLCFWCMLSGACCIAALLAISSDREVGSVRVIQPLPSFRPAFALMAFITLCWHAASAAGKYKPAEAEMLTAFAPPLGAPIGRITPGILWSASDPNVLVATLPGCHACETAKEELSSRRIRFRELSPCSYIQPEGCLDTHRQPGMYPLIIKLDSAQRIDGAWNGWPGTSKEITALLAQLASSHR